MTKKNICILVFALCAMVSLGCHSLYAAAYNDVLLIDDFNAKVTDNFLGGKSFGEEEKEGGCVPLFTEDAGEVYGNNGASLSLDYDVTFPGDFSFYVSQLNQTDATSQTNKPRDISSYNYFSFIYKSDLPRVNFAVEVHSDKNGDGRFILGSDTVDKVAISGYVKNYTPGDWHKVSIPFKDFQKITNWKSVFEFVIVFDKNLNSGKGRVVIDDLLFGSAYPVNTKEQVAFPSRMRVDSFKVNEQEIKNNASISKSSSADIIIKNQPSILEKICVQIRVEDSPKWITVLDFSAENHGIYSGEWMNIDIENTNYFVKIVAKDLFGRTAGIAGPYKISIKE